jgi:hypothetical protein
MFTIPEIYSIGPLLLPLRTLLFILIGILATFAVSSICKRLHTPFQTWKDILLNGLITYLIVWKLSYLLLDPMILLNNPIRLILANGGVIGHILGAALALFVIYRSAKKANYSLFMFFDLFMFWLLITLSVYWLIIRAYGLPTNLPWGIRFSDSSLAYHPIHIYQFLLSASIFLYLHLKKLPLGLGKYTTRSLLLLGIGLLLLSNLTLQLSSFLGLSILQWFYILLALTGFGLIQFKKTW